MLTIRHDDTVSFGEAISVPTSRKASRSWATHALAVAHHCVVPAGPLHPPDGRRLCSRLTLSDKGHALAASGGSVTTPSGISRDLTRIGEKCVTVTTAEGGLFAAGPPFRLERWLQLRRGGRHLVVLEALLAATVAWVPLALLAALRGDFVSSFLHDIGAHARYLLSLPLLILAESSTIPTLGTIARHFVDSGLVRDEDRPRFEAIIARTKRLLEPILADLIVVVLALCLSLLWTYSAPNYLVPAWYRGTGAAMRSAAGGWHMLVSLPLLLVLLLGWIWRVATWAYFLWLTSKLDLRLLPTHPDRAGGLLFVGNSTRAFALPASGLSVIAAGAVAGQVAYEGASLLAFKYLLVGLFALVVIIFASPLMVFSRKLYARWWEARLQYGMLALQAGIALQRRWADRPALGDDLLNTASFEALNNLYAVAGNVYQMRFVPLDKRSAYSLIEAALMPFLPVLLLAVPPEELLQRIRGFLI